MNLQRIDYRRDDVAAAVRIIRERLSVRGDVVSEAGRQRTIDVFGEPLLPRQVVQRICNDVRQQGIDAVLDYSARIDRAELTAGSLRVPAGDLEQAHAEAEPEFLDTIRKIRDNVLRFQQAILNRDVRIDVPDGGFLQQRYLPLRRAGICVPGGAAAYPSTVLMTAVPAQAAGVEQLAVIAPPTPFGAYNKDLLATCHEIGIREVYRLGGAQGVAALAYGVDGIERVDKIVGPGNLFVALAKQHVFGDVAIDSIAGPSEVVVVADETTRPDFSAADLIAQAEHSPGAGFLITASEPVWQETAAEIERQLETLDRGDLAGKSLEDFGALILTEDDTASVRLTNDIAPEHLHIATEDAESRLSDYVNAGAIFLGPYSPVAVGDYVAGPSHVLPTGGTARFAGGLSSNDFLRGGSVIQYSQAALNAVAADLGRMAGKEGLTAHAASVDVRLG
ncbi:MAG: histidinol dehydrogenase [Pirellulales bacterium]